jgi:hypothetical protein
MKTEVPVKIKKHSSKQRNAQYATDGDFRRIFAEDMKSLYFLSHVLTADSEKAEQCFVSGLDECTTDNQVFMEWARSWARRVVIRNAIRMIAPEPKGASRVLNPATARGGAVWNGGRAQGVPAEMSAVFELPPFERFAFVMSVLEGYSDPDCALLLGCTRQSLIQGRLRAFEQIAGVDDNVSRGDARSRAESLRGHRDSEELDLRVLATPA